MKRYLAGALLLASLLTPAWAGSVTPEAPEPRDPGLTDRVTFSAYETTLRGPHEPGGRALLDASTLEAWWLEHAPREAVPRPGGGWMAVPLEMPTVDWAHEWVIVAHPGVPRCINDELVVTRVHEVMFTGEVVVSYTNLRPSEGQICPLIAPRPGRVSVIVVAGAAPTGELNVVRDETSGTDGWPKGPGTPYFTLV